MRECDCPAWVLRCVHLDGGVACLTDTRLVTPEAGCECAPASAPYAYSSGFMYGSWQRCQHGTPGFYLTPERKAENTYRGDDFDAAQAGFEAAVARMRKET